MDLLTARKIARLNQQELADRAGVTASFICLLENGKRPIGSCSYQIVVRIARALNVEAEELFPVGPAPAGEIDEPRVIHARRGKAAKERRPSA
jgi:transcriptional regulator with XRE-family HTH domain